MSPTAFVSDPTSWLARLLGEAPALGARLGAVPLWALGALLALGLLALVAGARWRRPLALVGGACVGSLGGVGVAGLLGLSGMLLPAIGAAALGGAALALPPLFPFAALALPGAFLGAGAGLAGGRWLGALIGSFLLGGLGLLGARFVAAATAGLAGAGLVGAAILGAANRLPPLEPLSRRPVLLAGLLTVLAVAGTAFQVGSAWSATGGWRRASKPSLEADGPEAELQHP
jgi:hypothetical protein